MRRQSLVIRTMGYSFLTYKGTCMQYTKSSRNQLANASNPYQSSATKALCVCSAGLLRSPSIAKFLSSHDYNTRACGTSMEYALIPLSEALLLWSDEIHVVKEQAHVINLALGQLGMHREVYVYDIPDQYSTFDPELMALIEKQFNTSL